MAGQTEGDIAITVSGDVSPLTDAVATAERYLGQLKTATAAADQQFRTLAATTGDMQTRINALTGVSDRLTKSAQASASAFRGFARAQEQVDQLRSSFDPLYAASKRYEKAVESLDEALLKGVISQKEYESLVAKSASTYLSAAEEQKAATSRLGFQFQNASYQVGDFFVQIASGTDVVRAATQQIPQLVGGFGVAGAAIGALSAIVGAGIMMWSGYSDAANSASETAKANTDRLADLNKQLADFLAQKAALGQGKSSDEIFSIDNLSAAKATLDKANAVVAQIEVQMAKTAMNADTYLGFIVAGAAAEDKLTAAKAAQIAAQDTVNKLQIKQNDAINSELMSQEQKLALAEAELSYGKESAQYRETALSFQEAEYRQQLAQNGILGDAQNRVVTIWQAQQNVTDEIAKSSAATQSFVGHLGDVLTKIEAAQSALSQTGVSQAGADATLAALQKGLSASQATAAGAVAERTAKYNDDIASSSTEAAAAITAQYEADLKLLGTRQKIADLQQANSAARQQDNRLGITGADNQLNQLYQAASPDNVSQAVEQYKKYVSQVQEAVQRSMISAEDGGALQGGIFANLFGTDTTTLQDKYAEQLAVMQDAQASGLISRQQFADAMAQIDTDMLNTKLAAWSGAFGDLSGLMNTENRKLFKIGQAAAIAQAVVDGWTAATSAWTKGMAIGGPPVAAAFTAMSLAKTGAMIASIASASIGGSSGSGSGSSGSAASAAAAVNTSPTQYANFTIQGDVIGKQTGGALISAINQAVKDGYKINIDWE